MAFLTPFRVLWRQGQLERSCTWTRAELEQRQQNRLTELRRFALDRSPFYGRFHRGLEQRPLGGLPILTKALMMEHFDELVTDRAVRLSDADAFLRGDPGDHLFLDRYVVLSTSGSTGRRGVFLFDPEEWLTALAMITRPMAWAGAHSERLQATPLRDDRVNHALALLHSHQPIALQSDSAGAATRRRRLDRHDHRSAQRLAAGGARRLSVGAQAAG